MFTALTSALCAMLHRQQIIHKTHMEFTSVGPAWFINPAKSNHVAHEQKCTHMP